MPSYSASLAANLLCDLTCSSRFSRIKKCLGIHRQHLATRTGSLECAPLICGCECFPLSLCVGTFRIGFPPLCGLLPASAAHCGQCLTFSFLAAPEGVYAALPDCVTYPRTQVHRRKLRYCPPASNQRMRRQETSGAPTLSRPQKSFDNRAVTSTLRFVPQRCGIRLKHA